MNNADIRQSLEKYLADVRDIMAMFPEREAPTIEARERVRHAMQSLKERVKVDHTRQPRTSIEAEVFAPAMLKLFVTLQRVRLNTAPQREWFSALYDAEIELSYSLEHLD